MKNNKLFLKSILLFTMLFSAFVISSCDEATSESSNYSSLSESEISSEEISSESFSSMEESLSSTEIHEHTWNEGEVSKESTCTTDGEITYTCTSCNEIKFETISALGHIEVVDAAVEPTCTETGLTQGSHCDRCKEVLVAQEEVAALGHEYKISEHEDATCLEEGYTTYICSNDSTHTYKEVHTAIGHSYSSVVTEPTCVDKGYTTHICANCEDSYVDTFIDALGHNEVIDSAVAPTCTETGLIEGKHCDRCNEVLVEQKEVAALGHEYESIVTEPTCVDKGYTTHACNRCDDSYVESYVDALGHIYGDWKVIVEPDCESVGINRRYCSLCDYFEEEEIPALGHVEIVEDGLESTCESTGLTEGVYCDVCKKTLKKQETISYKDHVFSEGNCVDCGCTEGLIYELSTDGSYYSVIGIDNNDTSEIVIPLIYNGLPVVSIGKKAFDFCSFITNVTLSDGITLIDSYAFKDCTSLTNINFPNSLQKIGTGSFENCVSLENVVFQNPKTEIGLSSFAYCKSLSTVVLPSNITHITGYAFMQCINLENIEIPESVTTIGPYAFSFCRKIDSSIITNNITSIGSAAFEYCNFEDITFSNNIVEIGSGAFENNEIEEIYIPKNVEIIGTAPFKGCLGLNKIVVSEENIFYDSRNDCNAIIETATNTLIEGCINTIIPDSIVIIGNSAFSTTSIESIEIPNSVQYIDDYAFKYCFYLSNIEIPDSVISIGQYAFEGCDGMSYITFNTGLKSIGYYAFSDCNSLENVFYTGTEEEWKNIKISQGNMSLLLSNKIFNS